MAGKLLYLNDHMLRQHSGRDVERGVQLADPAGTIKEKPKASKLIVAADCW